jgi:plastocyanin
MKRLSALSLAVGVLALAGCGGSSSGTGSTASTPASPAATSTTSSTPPASTGPSTGQDLALAATPEGQLKYDKTALTANAGEVSIAFTNMSPLDHNMTIESASSHKILGATPTFSGATKDLKLDLKPGVYKFFCTVPGHRMAGMEGTLTVK